MSTGCAQWGLFPLVLRDGPRRQLPSSPQRRGFHFLFDDSASNSVSLDYSPTSPLAFRLYLQAPTFSCSGGQPVFSLHTLPSWRVSFAVAFCACFVPVSYAAADFQITPAAVVLEGNFARAQLVVTERAANGVINERSPDLTHQARYVSSDPGIASVNAGG